MPICDTIQKSNIDTVRYDEDLNNRSSEVLRRTFEK